jgi:hypothetical protein
VGGWRQKTGHVPHGHYRPHARQFKLAAVLDPVTVPCQECGRDLAADSPELRLMLTCDEEPIIYCETCREREVRD